MIYVYFLLLCNKDIYKGSSDNLKRRLQEHKRGNVASTRNFRPVLLIGFEGYAFKSDAQRREKFLKTTEGRRFFRQQYRDILKKYLLDWNSILLYVLVVKWISWQASDLLLGVRIPPGTPVLRSAERSCAPIAQLVEQLPLKEKVKGSSPLRRT